MALKMGEKAKLFCWLALKLEGRLNWNNYGSPNQLSVILIRAQLAFILTFDRSFMKILKRAKVIPGEHPSL